MDEPIGNDNIKLEEDNIINSEEVTFLLLVIL